MPCTCCSIGAMLPSAVRATFLALQSVSQVRSASVGGYDEMMRTNGEDTPHLTRLSKKKGNFCTFRPPRPTHLRHDTVPFHPSTLIGAGGAFGVNGLLKWPAARFPPWGHAVVCSLPLQFPSVLCGRISKLTAGNLRHFAGSCTGLFPLSLDFRLWLAARRDCRRKKLAK